MDTQPPEASRGDTPHLESLRASTPHLGPSRDGLPPPPPGPATEEHFTASAMVRDLVIGMADGLTVPFALAAGLSGAVAANPLIVTAGLAEIAAGCVAMGLGGYLAARTDAEHYVVERRREEQETHDWSDRERWEVMAVLHRFGLRDTALHEATNAVCSDRKRWVDFMMRFELELNEPEPGRAAKSAATIGGAYAVGGMIPLMPYILLDDVTRSLVLSSVCTGLALLFFGWLKARATGLPPLKGALQTFMVGGLAASVAYIIAKWVGG